MRALLKITPKTFPYILDRRQQAFCHSQQSAELLAAAQKEQRNRDHFSLAEVHCWRQHDHHHHDPSERQEEQGSSSEQDPARHCRPQPRHRRSTEPASFQQVAGRLWRNRPAARFRPDQGVQEGQDAESGRFPARSSRQLGRTVGCERKWGR